MGYLRIIAGGVLAAILVSTPGNRTGIGLIDCSSSYVVEERITDADALLKNRLALERFVQREYSPNSKIAQRNNQYLIDNIISMSDVQAVVASPQLARQSLVDKLTSVSHAYRGDHAGMRYKDSFNDPMPYIYDERPAEAANLTNRQLLRVYLLMKSLRCEDFVSNIADIIGQDLRDHYSEHGGLIIFDENGRLVFHPVESEFTKQKNPKNNTHFGQPEDLWERPHITDYHLHAISQDNSEMAGPTVSDLHSNEKEFLREEVHGVVVTKLQGRKFNIDYYATERIRDTKFFTILDLGNFKY